MRWQYVPFKRRSIPFWTWRIEFKREDLWVGVFWKWDAARPGTDVWVCVVPMLPLHIRTHDVPF